MTPDLAARLRSASKADGNQYELCLSVAEVRQIMHQLDELEKLRQEVLEQVREQTGVDAFCEKLRHLPAPPETDAKA
jgi:septum formation topological specificity factor MinE